MFQRLLPNTNTNTTETATPQRCHWPASICNVTRTSFLSRWQGGLKLFSKSKNSTNIRLLPNLERISMANFERSESYLDGEDHLPILASFKRFSSQFSQSSWSWSFKRFLSQFSIILPQPRSPHPQRCRPAPPPCTPQVIRRRKYKQMKYRNTPQVSLTFDRIDVTIIVLRLNGIRAFTKSLTIYS